MDVSEWRRLLSEPATPDNVLLELARHPDVDPAALAALAADGPRLRRAPEIAAAIFHNQRASMSAANTAVSTCQREGVAPEGIPAFAELAAAIAADPLAVDPVASDATFTDLLQRAEQSSGGADLSDSPDGRGDQGGQEGGLEESQDAKAEGESAAEAAAGSDGAEAPETADKSKSKKGRSPPIDFTRLKLYEKIRLATLGNLHCRQTLMRDSNRMVALAAIRSPRITDSEIVKAAANRALSEEVIRYIANRKELIKLYAVKLALVGNAKCPLALTLKFLPQLHAEDVKSISRSKNVPGALSVAARRLAAAREPK